VWGLFLGSSPMLVGHQVSINDDLLLSLAPKSAFLGLAASYVSDTASITRVIKTTKQTAQLGADSERIRALADLILMILGNGWPCEGLFWPWLPDAF
jgi:hypothetical protein